MEVGLFLFGLLIGIFIGWRWQDDERPSDVQDARGLRQRTAAAETRVRDLEATRDALDARVTALEQELATARQGAAEMQRRQAEAVKALQAERDQASHAAPATQSGAAQAAAASPAAADDLTIIKGIGPKLAIKLRELGITSFHQLAALTREDAARIDAAIDFPGRVGREHWVEQAREILAGAGPTPLPPAGGSGARPSPRRA